MSSEASIARFGLNFQRLKMTIESGVSVLALKNQSASIRSYLENVVTGRLFRMRLAREGQFSREDECFSKWGKGDGLLEILVALPSKQETASRNCFAFVTGTDSASADSDFAP
jgi:hypothetical protein